MGPEGWIWYRCCQVQVQVEVQVQELTMVGTWYVQRLLLLAGKCTDRYSRYNLVTELYLSLLVAGAELPGRVISLVILHHLQGPGLAVQVCIGGVVQLLSCAVVEVCSC